MMDDADLADVVLSLVGGPANVAAVTACASRLRLELRDPTARNDVGLRALPEVVMVLEQAGQFQVVLGARAMPVSRVVATRLG